MSKATLALELHRIVLCIGGDGDGQCNNDSAPAGSSINAGGFIEHGAGGGKGCGFDAVDCCRGPRVVCLVEDVVDASNERGGILVTVLVAIIGGECELCDAGANVLTGGCTCGEAHVHHG